MTAAARAIPVIAKITMRPFIGVIVIGMTTCTAIGVSREWPWNRLTVAPVTGVTGQTDAMITGIVAGSVAVVCHWQPPVDGMAIITLHSGHEMSLGLACCCGAVMAGVTVPGHSSVIESHRSPCGGRGMTVVTLGRCHHMVRRLARGEVAIVAVGAGTGHTAMAEPYVQPVAGGQVTDVALFRGWNVVRRFTGGQSPIMAT